VWKKGTINMYFESVNDAKPFACTLYLHPPIPKAKTEKKKKEKKKKKKPTPRQS